MLSLIDISTTGYRPSCLKVTRPIKWLCDLFATWNPPPRVHYCVIIRQTTLSYVILLRLGLDTDRWIFAQPTLLGRPNPAQYRWILSLNTNDILLWFGLTRGSDFGPSRHSWPRTAPLDTYGPAPLSWPDPARCRRMRSSEYLRYIIGPANDYLYMGYKY